MGGTVIGRMAGYLRIGIFSIACWIQENVPIPGLEPGYRSGDNHTPCDEDAKRDCENLFPSVFFKELTET